MTDSFDIHKFSKVRYSPRAHYDKATVFDILDHGVVAHVGLVIEDRPIVIPMIYARAGDTLYIHGAKATRIIKGPAETAPACLTVTHIDALVVARSAFHHSMNYRSVVVHGHIRKVESPEERTLALTTITNHLAPKRWDEVRPMSDKELKATGVLALEIETASAKIRTGPPIDETQDLNLDIWSGLLPIHTQFGAPEADSHSIDLSPPESLQYAKAKFET